MNVLNKMQEGGALIYTPRLSSSRAQQQSSSGSSSSEKDSKPNQLSDVDKQIFGLLQSGKLLPSDARHLTEMLGEYYQSISHLSNYSMFGGPEDNMAFMPALLGILEQISNGTYYNQQATVGEDRLKTTNSYGDAALDPYGRFYVRYDDGSIGNMSPKQYYKIVDEEKPQVLSNSEILAIRKNDPRYAMDPSLLNAVASAYGLQESDKELFNIISKYGTKENVALFSQNDAAKTGLLGIALDPTTVYKYTTKTEVDNINAAINAMLKMLSPDAIKTYRARAALLDMDPDKGLIDVIKDAIVRNTDVSQALDVDATASRIAGGGGSSSSSADGDKPSKEMAYAQEIATGTNLEVPRQSVIGLEDQYTNLHFFVQPVGVIKKGNGKDTESTTPSMYDKLRQDAPVIDELSQQNTVTFGRAMLDRAQQERLLYVGDVTQRVQLPAKIVNGEVTVDWETLDDLNNLKATTEGSVQDWTDGMIETFLANRGLSDTIKYDKEAKEFVAKNPQWFLATKGVIASNYVEGLPKDFEKWLQRLSGPEEKMWKDKYTDARRWGYTSWSGSKKPDVPGIPTENKFLGIDWKKDTMYSGTIYIPITNRLAGMRQYYDPKNYTNNERDLRASDWRENEKERYQSGEVRTNFNWGKIGK